MRLLSSAVLLVCAVVACNDSPTSSSANQPAAQTADVQLFISNSGNTLTYAIRNNGPAGADLNWLRLHCQSGQTKEIGVADFINFLGNNRAPAGTNTTGTVQGLSFCGVVSACSLGTCTGPPWNFTNQAELNYTDPTGQHTVSAQ